jgi:hypothetical protein
VRRGIDKSYYTWNTGYLYRRRSLITVSKEEVRFSGSAGGQRLGRRHRTSRTHIFYGQGNENNELDKGFLCKRGSYQKLSGLSLLVIGY